MIDLESLIAEYVALRDRKKTVTEEFAAAVQREFTDRMDAIENEIGEFFKATNQDNAKTKAGTAMRKTVVSVTTANADEFRRHVIGGELWELSEWRPSKSAIMALVDGGSGVPPGINYVPRFDIQIRRPSDGK